MRSCGARTSASLSGAGVTSATSLSPHALHAVFVRSPHAHARIDRIDASAALRVPGVVAVWTGADMAKAATTLRVAPPIEGLKPVDLPPFPADKVRFVGDLVACVVAETRAAALDGAEAVVVDYAALAAVPDIATARLSSSAPVDPEYQSNLISHQSFAEGDVEAAFSRAPRIVEARFAQHRQTHAPIEPRGCIADWDAGRRHLTFRSGNQAPHPFRTALAARLKLKETQVTVISPDVGGGFGLKIVLLREELCVAALSIAFERPGALGGGTRREPDRRAARARRDDRHAYRSDSRRAHPGARCPDRGRLRRLLLLPGELHGTRYRDDPARAISNSGLRL